MRFIKEYLSKTLSVHTQKTTLHLFLRIHVYLYKHRNDRLERHILNTQL